VHFVGLCSMNWSHLTTKLPSKTS